MIDPGDDAIDGDDEADLRALMQAAGRRPEPPPAAAAEVQAAVAAQWRATVAERQTRRRSVSWLAAAASIAAVGVGTWLVASRMPAPAEIATVARLEGPVEIRHDSATAWQPLRGLARLRPGDEVRTSAAGRVALRRPDGLEVRLDVATTLRVIDEDEAALDAGRLYVDAGAGAGGHDFVVSTPQGDVRHLGTQYGAAVAAGAIEIAVREGRIAIERGASPVLAQAGESVRIAADGTVARRAVDPYGAEWRWTQAVVPEFAIEGRSLDEFLTWAARETGHRLVYGSIEAAHAAESTELKGSVAGLEPEAAVAAVLTTTPQLRHRFAGPQLRVERVVP